MREPRGGGRPSPAGRGEEGRVGGGETRGAAGPPLSLMKFKFLGVCLPPAGPGGTARLRGQRGGRAAPSETGAAVSPASPQLLDRRWRPASAGSRGDSLPSPLPPGPSLPSPGVKKKPKQFGPYL